MSNRSDIPCTEEMSEYYGGIPAHWSTIPATPLIGVTSPYCTESLAPNSLLTPISLPDNSFHPSPAISHHSQGYHAQEYQYSLNDPLSAPLGLGISAPFPSNFPQSSAPDPAYLYAPDPSLLQHGVAQTPSQSPQGPPPAKRARLPSSETPSREQPSNTPVSIAPNPEGVLRMQQDRQHVQPTSHILPRIRAPGRGRRDPQAEDEDAFVEELRDRHTAWKVVRQEFQERFKKDASEARLQMRLHRRYRERMVRWEESDIKLLIDAHGIWARDKFHYISDKMKELGGTRLYSPDQCRTQLRLLDAKNQHRDRESESPSAMSDPAPMTPTVSRKRPRAQSLESDIDEEATF
ncbi:hypothetical protein N7536_004942 [Penicillium majusculum]|uniref:Uncharacterized protein n=1 Tax=Penicillium solitum TaxID=60172 RepID=A0A1V6RHS4_9EURO|nr:uncharacterized protein PENSOL_c005G05956 [Penicillium solitum]KAJ5694530.1 hypothetical protein N7536_004942 [Penicillium majusculum]OQE01048.1 hypothetical protein PENSOL_c005G05956 [Penicillium solitum]